MSIRADLADAIKALDNYLSTVDTTEVNVVELKRVSNLLESIKTDLRQLEQAVEKIYQEL